MKQIKERNPELYERKATWLRIAYSSSAPEVTDAINFAIKEKLNEENMNKCAYFN